MPSRLRLSTALGVLAGVAGLAAIGRAEPAVTLFYEPRVLPGDATRDGAAEFSVLVQVAQLRQHHPLAGLVCVGNRCVLLAIRTEATLGRVALMGVPVVKLPGGGERPANPAQVFVEARAMDPAAAQRLLATCLARYGAPPAARDPARPTPPELDAIRAKVSQYQALFDAANRPAEVAMR